MKRTLMLLFAALLITSCATVYKKVGFMGGFSETQLSENIFQVSFRGNGYTSSERASDFALLRSAELALQNGFRYFIIIESGQKTSLSTYTTPQTSTTTANIYSSGNYASGTATTYTTGGQVYLISKPRASNTIFCLREKPETSVFVYDAGFINKSIRTKYRLPAR